MTSNTNEPSKVAFWYDKEKRAIIYQVMAILVVGLISYYLFSNTQANLEKQNISTGFGFFEKESSFEISESLVKYSAADTYADALWVGVLNTLKVAFIGIILTTLLGTFVGVARLSSNWLISRLAAIYIEVLQNIPILLQLFFFYSLFSELLPGPRDALIPIKGILLCNRGIYFTIPADHPVYFYMGMAFLLAIFICVLLTRKSKKIQEQTGNTMFQLFYIKLESSAPSLMRIFSPIFNGPFANTLFSVFILLLLPFIVWLIGGAPTELNAPALAGFNIEGGTNFSPEFGALLTGLVIYTSAFVAEVVRAGIQSVSSGQSEAAKSLGLKPGLILNLIILPQALRVIIPPLTSQLLNLTKNSSLAVAIGYPDFVFVANTTINQTGQAIEGVAMIMVVYLCFSLLTSVFMNWYNKKMALVER
ncbi:MAG: ABC transporter permease subunit [Desulfobacterales bacterium]|nr:ABC transporter permease subunit [Desulfobacterales bacterium]MCP4161551.1 ABC transporter permease subunit [Deltaproteobacteria bacterium]